jgi:signal transduction histidine kinase/ligand-binding sensor domain-containing protein
VILSFLLCAPIASALSRYDGPIAGYFHKQWTEFDGVRKTPGVFAITQDRVGYIWLGFLDGIARFDGARFVRWEDLNLPALPEHVITALTVSRDDSLWIGFGNLGGVARLRDGILQSYPLGSGVLEGAVRQIVEDSDGTIWASGYGGIARLRGNRWDRVSGAHGLGDSTVHILYRSPRGDLWVVTEDGVFHHSESTDTFEYAGPKSSGLVIFRDDVSPSRWTTEARNAFRELDPNVQSPILRDHRGQFWLPTHGGLIHAGVPSERATPRIDWLNTQNGLTSNRIVALFDDRDGNVWIGTQAGLDLLSLKKPQHLANLPHLAHSQVNALATSTQGDIWAGTEDGLHHLSNGEARTYHVHDGLPGEAVRALHIDRGGVLWIATNGGVARFTKGHFYSVPVSYDTHLDHVGSLTADHEGGLWLCDSTSLRRLKDGVLTTVTDGGIAGRRPNVVFTDSRGGVWIGFWSGGVAVAHDGRVDTYGPKDGLASGRVTTIYEDGAQNVWVGTLTGLSRFQHGRFATPSDQSGLSGHMVLGIAEDTHDYLWLGTFSGLIRVPRSELDQAMRDQTYRPAHQIFGPKDGLDNPVRVIKRAPDGTVWIAPPLGVTILDPRQVRETDTEHVRVEQISTDERTFGIAAPPRLPAGTSRVQIDYTSLAYAFPLHLQFRYRLEGFDKDWINAGSTRRAIYTNLPPRAYRFRVAASNEGGRWNEASAPLEFSIQPVFYQTTWFFATVAIGLALSVWGAWRVHVHQVHRRYALVLKERARLGREIHDTLLQGMIGVMLQIHGISERLGEPSDVLKSRLERARKCLAHYIRETRVSIWELRSPAIDRPELSSALREVGETLTADCAASFELMVHGTPRQIDARVEQSLVRIGHEAIANAVRHADPTVIHVDLLYADDSLALRVRDNGQGFDPEGMSQISGHRWGLSTMRERAQQMGARFTCASRPNGGTEIVTIAPVTAIR